MCLDDEVDEDRAGVRTLNLKANLGTGTSRMCVLRARFKFKVALRGAFARQIGANLIKEECNKDTQLQRVKRCYLRARFKFAR